MSESDLLLIKRFKIMFYLFSTCYNVRMRILTSSCMANNNNNNNKVYLLFDFELDSYDSPKYVYKYQNMNSNFKHS